MSRIGYARVSTDQQDTALQVDALRKAGCEKIFQDKGVSGSLVKRPQLDKCLKSLQEGDTLVVWKIDRLGRSLAHLASTLDDLQKRGIKFLSLTEHLDTSTHMGRAMYQMAGIFAELERGWIAERTYAGRIAARKRGVRFGRPVKMTSAQIKHARKQVEDGTPVPEIASLLGVSRWTVYRALRLTQQAA
jgi:DNA invertase Pin-like site-specific DNA recombinase